MFLKSIGALLLCSVLVPAFSQILSDALGYHENAALFSRVNYQGSGRMTAMGGTATALGADMFGIPINPAGLGMYRKGDLGLSFSLLNGRTTSDYTSPTSNSSYATGFSNFSMPNIGVVFTNTNDAPNDGPWRSGSFAITLNRLDDYNRTVSYRGTNGDGSSSPLNSMREWFVYEANASGINPGSLDDQLGNNNSVDDIFGAAYWNYMLNYDDEAGRYFTIDPDADVIQDEVITETGKKQQLNFAYAGNYDDRLYIGANIGVLFIDYTKKRVFTEQSGENESTFQDFTLTQEESTSGTGINLNVGALYRFTDWLRWGVSLQTPTALGLTEEYSADMTTNYDNLEFEDGGTVNNLQTNVRGSQLEYQLSTPLIFRTGISSFFSKNGFITVEMEYIPYRTMNLSTDFDPLRGDNGVIQNRYNSGINVKVGGEYRYDNLRFRGGYAYYDRQAKKEFNLPLNRSMHNITTGFGFRFKDYYTDISFVYNMISEAYSRYEYPGGESSYTVEASSNRLFVTLSGGLLF